MSSMCVKLARVHILVMLWATILPRPLGNLSSTPSRTRQSRSLGNHYVTPSGTTPHHPQNPMQRRVTVVCAVANVPLCIVGGLSVVGSPLVFRGRNRAERQQEAYKLLLAAVAADDMTRARQILLAFINKNKYVSMDSSRVTFSTTNKTFQWA